MDKFENLVVVDFQKEGNVVRFYLGKNLEEAWGDDWNDVPYEHNAGTVYEEYYEAYMDIAWGLDYAVCEPCDGYYNSPFCKVDFKKRNLPVIVAKKMEKYEFIDNFINCLTRADHKIFLGDSAVSLSEKGHMVDFFHK